MQAFHNDPKIKAKYLERVRAHALADEIVKGQYWNNGKGCAVGCTIHGSDHQRYETELGIPRLIARLEDGIFEGLPNELAKTWPERFLKAIKPGADLSLVWPKFAEWMLVDEAWGVIKFAKTDSQREAIQKVADFYAIEATGKNIDRKDWLKARAAAAAAADAAAADAYAAYAAAAADAADAAAYAAYAADAAAYDAADAADAAAAAYDAAAAADAAAADAYDAAAADAAYAAYAADAAAYDAADAAAADAAADAYDAAAADAAYAAADAARDAREKTRTAQSEKLIELLMAAK